MTTIIILSVVAVLILIGATQRQKLSTWVKGSANDFIEEKMSSITVAKQKIRDLKEGAKKLVNQAAELMAAEEAQKKTLASLKDQLGSAQNAAKVAKKDNKKELAMTQLSMIKELKSQITLGEENISTIETNRVQLETKIIKAKNLINTYDIQIQGLKARKDTNDVLTKVVVGLGTDDPLKDIINGCEKKVSAEEVKLAYKTDLVEDPNIYSADVEKEYEEL